MDKREVIARLSEEESERMLLSRLWDKARLCRERNIPAHTAFLSPREQALARQFFTIQGVENLRYWGGYPQAERQQIHFLPDWAEEPQYSAVTAICAQWYASESLTHRDLLGSLMGAGITRESVGDILVRAGDHRADILVTDTIAPYLLEHWDCAGRVHLHCSVLPSDGIQPPEITVKEIRDTVSSLRLDNITAAAFSLSRSRAQEAVDSGRVEINWINAAKGDKPVAQGDTITVRGLGKCRITWVGQPNQKGRYPVVIQRFLS